MKLHSRLTPQEIGRKEMLAHIFEVYGKTEADINAIQEAVKRWSACYNWPDEESKLQAEADLFNKMLRM